jgi:hypothetical protein
MRQDPPPGIEPLSPAMRGTWPKQSKPRLQMRSPYSTHKPPAAIS